MIRLLVLIFLFSFIASASHHEENHTESEVNLRVFKKIRDNTRFMFELTQREEALNNTFKSFRTGGYVRLNRNFKLGLFYTRQSGFLHESDSFQKWESGKWIRHWRDTSNRWEDLLTLDLTYRKLATANLVFELKTRYTHNDFNSIKFLRLRPGLTYFLKKDALPFFNFYVQYESYLPQSDYSDETVYETWLYAGALYHISSVYKIGLSYARRNIKWDYDDLYSTVYGLNFLIYL